MKGPFHFGASLCLILLNFACFIPRASGQSITIDASSLDHASYRFTGPGIDQTWTIQEAQTFELSESGDCFVFINPNEGLTAILKLSLGEEGGIDAVFWSDGDSSQTGGNYQTLPSSLYSILSEGSELKITGNSFSVSMSSPANDSLRVDQFEYDGGGGVFTCLPGDYSVSVAGNIGKLQFECDTQYAVNEAKVLWKGLGSTSFVHLDSDFWKLNAEDESLILTGEEYLLDMHYNEDQNLSVGHLKGNLDEVTAGDSLRLFLLPGSYQASLYDVNTDSLDASLQFSIGAESAEVNSEIQWKDEKGNSSGGAFLTVDAGVVVRGRKSISLIQVLPDPDSNTPPQYARLSRDYDGAYYLTQNGKLRFKYEEWYNSSEQLRYAIRDMNNQDQTPSISLNKTFGPNWLELDLSTSGLTSGQTYVLDVWNAKGDHRWLRFRKD